MLCEVCHKTKVSHTVLCALIPNDDKTNPNNWEKDDRLALCENCTNLGKALDPLLLKSFLFSAIKASLNDSLCFDASRN